MEDIVYNLDYYRDCLNPWSEINCMIKMGMSYFKCSCRCNVFKKHKIIPLKYKCNSCNATYTGEI